MSPEIENLRINLPDNINIEVSENIDSKVLEKTVEILEEMTSNFKRKFLGLVSNDENVKPQLRERLVDFLEKHSLLEPRFSILDFEASEKFRKTLDLNSEEEYVCPLSDPESFMVVLNIPKPMQAWWDKGGIENWGKKAKDVEHKVVEWGLYYRKSLPEIWSILDDTKDKKIISIKKMTKNEQHVRDKFYYVWEVSEAIPIDDTQIEWDKEDRELIGFETLQSLMEKN